MSVTNLPFLVVFCIFIVIGGQHFQEVAQLFCTVPDSPLPYTITLRSAYANSTQVRMPPSQLHSVQDLYLWKATYPMLHTEILGISTAKNTIYLSQVLLFSWANVYCDNMGFGDQRYLTCDCREAESRRTRIWKSKQLDFQRRYFNGDSNSWVWPYCCGLSFVATLSLWPGPVILFLERWSHCIRDVHSTVSSF